MASSARSYRIAVGLECTIFACILWLLPSIVAWVAILACVIYSWFSATGQLVLNWAISCLESEEQAAQRSAKRYDDISKNISWKGKPQ